jgi:hypothetical protein
MERYSLLSAPSSSTRSSPAPGPQSVVVLSAAGAAHIPHRSLPASQVARGGNGNVGPASRAGGFEVDMASAYSDSAPARECSYLRSSYNVY